MCNSVWQLNCVVHVTGDRGRDCVCVLLPVMGYSVSDGMGSFLGAAVAVFVVARAAAVMVYS